MLKITAVAILVLSQFFGAPSTGPAAASTAIQSPALARTMPMQSDLDDGGSGVSNPGVLPTLKYCDLIDHSERYAGKLVRVSASWKFGFETTSLFDAKCPEKPGAWLEFLEDKDSCPETKKNRESPGPHDKEADVTVSGRLVGPGRYGHLGAYEYKFVVTCLEKIKVTASDLK